MSDLEIEEALDPEQSSGATTSVSDLIQISEAIHQNIRFADTKAATLAPINLAAIGAIFAAPMHFKATSGVALGIIGVVIAFGVWFSLRTLRPRGTEAASRDPGVVDPVRITRYSREADDFSAFVAGLCSADRVHRELAEQIYDRARINNAKYEALKSAIAFSSVGWISLMLIGVASLMSNDIAIG